MTTNTEHLIKVSDPAPIANGDIESAFLGAALLDPLVAPLYLDVPPEAFYFQEHQIIWEAMIYLARQGKPVDLTSVRVTILDYKHPDQASCLARLLDVVTGSYSHDFYMSVNIALIAGLSVAFYFITKIVFVGILIAFGAVILANTFVGLYYLLFPDVKDGSGEFLN